jgi:hypothetical protein
VEDDLASCALHPHKYPESKPPQLVFSLSSGSLIDTYLFSALCTPPAGPIVVTPEVLLLAIDAG